MSVEDTGGPLKVPVGKAHTLADVQRVRPYDRSRRGARRRRIALGTPRAAGAGGAGDPKRDLRNRHQGDRCAHAARARRQGRPVRGRRRWQDRAADRNDSQHGRTSRRRQSLLRHRRALSRGRRVVSRDAGGGRAAEHGDGLRPDERAAGQPAFGWVTRRSPWRNTFGTTSIGTCCCSSTTSSGSSRRARKSPGSWAACPRGWATSPRWAPSCPRSRSALPIRRAVPSPPSRRCMCRPMTSRTRPPSTRSRIFPQRSCCRANGPVRGFSRRSIHCSPAPRCSRPESPASGITTSRRRFAAPLPSTRSSRTSSRCSVSSNSRQEDRNVVGRARRLERFLTQPFFATEQFSGLPGKTVSLEGCLGGLRAHSAR